MPSNKAIVVGSFHTHLQVLELDLASRSLRLSTLSDPAFDNYTWLVKSTRHDGLIYAARAPADESEGELSVIRVIREDEGDAGSSASTYRLEILQTVPSGGVDPCHAGISEDGKLIALTNYNSSNVVVYDIMPDGLIRVSGPRIYDFTQSAYAFKHGPDAQRQEAPHPHGAFWHSGLQDFVVPDLGSDKLRLLTKRTSIASKAGAGPRHVALHPNGKYIYAVNELDNTITVHRVDGQAGAAAESSSESDNRLSVLPSDVDSSKASQMNAAAILISPDSKTIYVTNRLEGNSAGEAIVWFSVAEDGSRLRREGEIRSGLDHPRGAELLTIDGAQYLITGSRTEKGAVVYECDPANGGALKELARNDHVLQPSCFVVV